MSRSKISEKIVNELNASNDDVKPAIVQKYEIKQEALHSSSATPPISFLSETSVDNFLSCKVEAKQYADIITNFLHKFDSIVHYQSTVVAPLYCEISYDVEKQSIVSDIFANQEKILEELKIGAFNLLYKNNSVRFEILNKTPSKISLKSILASCKNVQPNQYVVGADESGKPLLVDISKNTNTVLMGTKGSGVSMLMTVMLVSLAYTNTPKKMGMIVLSPRSDKSLKYLSRLPHLTLPVQHEQLEITKALTNLQIEINNREALFAKSKVRSLKEYNDKNNNEVDNLKQMVVVINNFNIISKISVENYRLIIDLLKRGASVGVSVILMTNNVDHQLLDKDIYKNLDVKLVMKLEFEQESIQLLDSRRGVELFGNGDGYYFDNKLKINLRFQSCYMNIDELDQIVKIIETFYSVKSKLI